MLFKVRNAISIIIDSIEGIDKNLSFNFIL